MALPVLSQRLAVLHPPIDDVLQVQFPFFCILDVANFFVPRLVDFFAKIEVVHCVDNQLVAGQKG